MGKKEGKNEMGDRGWYFLILFGFLTFSRDG